MIEFAQPERLWGLGLGILILLLALPPRPQREVLTAHLPQWLRALRRHKRSPLRYPWLRTLLLLLAFCAAVMAGSRPRVPARPGPTQLRVVVDASASLHARQVQGSAWDDLRRALRQGLDRLPPHVRARVEFVRCDRLVQFLREVDDLGAPSPCALGMDLARVARAAQTDDVAVWTLTDGRAAVPTLGALTLVGRVADNVGITALRVDDRWPLPDVELEIEVGNFTSSARPVTVRVAAAATVLEEPSPPPVTCQLAQGAREVVRWSLRRRTGGDVRVQIDGDDALALDDAVRCTLPPPPAPRIAVQSDSDAPFLRTAAEVLAAETGGEVVAATERDARVSFVLVEGGVQRAADWADLPGLTFGTRFVVDGAAPPDPAPLLGTAIEWDRTDALTRGLDFSEVRVARLAAVVTGAALLQQGDVPLAARAPNGRAVHFAFRLSDSNLWLLPAFPQLLRRCYAAAHADTAKVGFAADNLVDAGESDLRAVDPASDRPLPPFGAPAIDLTAWFALAALLALLARVALPQA